MSGAVKFPSLSTVNKAVVGISICIVPGFISPFLSATFPVIVTVCSFELLFIVKSLF